MSTNTLRIFRIDEPAIPSGLNSLLPEAYRTGHPWPLYVNGLKDSGFNVLLLPEPPADKAFAESVGVYGHRSGPSLYMGTGIDAAQVRSWAVHGEGRVTDVTDMTNVSAIPPAENLLLTEKAYLNVPNTEPVVTEDAAAERLRTDLNLLSEMLLEEANNRGWCEDYDDFVEAFNGRSTVAKLTPCERETEWTVRITRTITSEVRVGMLHRRDLDDPEERIEELAIEQVANGYGDTVDQEYTVDSIERY